MSPTDMMENDENWGANRVNPANTGEKYIARFQFLHSSFEDHIEGLGGLEAGSGPWAVCLKPLA